MSLMTDYQKKHIQTVILTCLPILIAYSCRMINMNRVAALTSLTIARSILYLFAFGVWAFSVHNRVVQKKAGAYLTSAACLMVFWIAIRTVKYLLPESCYIVHWLWYLFYLPLIYIPMFTLFVAYSICQKEDFIIPTKLRILYVPAAILLLFVLTNDLHHLVFVFPPDGPKYPVDGYSHGPVYYAVACWIAACFTGVVALVFIRNRIADKTRRILGPVAILGMLAVYSILYFMNVPLVYFWLGDFTIVFCLFFLVFYESLFRLNLIQNNTRYSELFRYTSIPAIIVNSDYEEEVHTASYADISNDSIRQAETAPVIMKDGIRLSSAPIRNGHVLWEEDISGLIDLKEELMSVHLNIEEQNTAELEAYKTEYQWRRLVEKNRLYDKLQERTQNKVNRLSELLDELEKTNDMIEEKQLLLQISVIGAYIKRRNNLSFLMEDWSQFPPNELKNCIEQSIEALRLFGIEAEQAFYLKKDMLIEDTIQLFEAYEEVIEYSIDKLSEIAITFLEKEHGILMSLRLCAETDFSSFSLDGMTVQNEGDGEWLLNYFVESGGAHI